MLKLERKIQFYFLQNNFIYFSNKFHFNRLKKELKTQNLKKKISYHTKHLNTMPHLAINFVRTNNLFKATDWNAAERSSLNQIQWNFNPLAASWWKGL